MMWRAAVRKEEPKEVKIRWVSERCCPDPTCPGSWWVRNLMSYHLADDGGDRQGVFPTSEEAQSFADRLNREETGAGKV